MEPAGSSYQCPKCYLHFCPDNLIAENDLADLEDTKRLTLSDWTVYPADSPVHDLPLPQQVEGDICWWLQFMTTQLEMMNNPQRLYGKIVFDPMGDIFDFEVRSLEQPMLAQGFNNWMNTLSSGEILLDIVNGLINSIPEETARMSSRKLKPLTVKRMLQVAPNKAAIFDFLLNFDCLIGDFLEPILEEVRPIENPVELGPMKDCRQAVKLLRHIGHSLLRNSFTTREWSWKALMVIVMILMALTGSLSSNLEKIFYCLTGEYDTDSLIIVELHEAFQSAKDRVVPGVKYSSSFTLQNYFPYRRVLKQGRIKFKSQLSAEFNLD